MGGEPPALAAKLKNQPLEIGSQAAGEVARKWRIALTTVTGESVLSAPLANDNLGVNALGGSARPKGRGSRPRTRGVISSGTL